MPHVSLTGFSNFSTSKSGHHDEHSVADIDLIIQQLHNLPIYQSFIEMVTNLTRHIASSQPHHFNIQAWSDQLIKQLYTSYRSIGKIGSVADMLKSIIKNIKVGSIEQHDYFGYSYEKAVHVLGWWLLFDDHIEHGERHLWLKELVPSDGILKEPSFVFNPLISEQLSLTTDGYTLSEWNTQQGTLFFDVRYTRDISSTKLFDIFYIDKVLSGEFDFSNNKLNFTYDNNILLSIDLLTSTSTIGRYVLGYNSDGWLLRDAAKQVSTQIIIPDRPVSLKIYYPISNCKDSVRDFQYYSSFMGASEQAYLINQ